ncbi:PREDICTED: vinorine synthase-like [Fragaria vesca subsp. vesca]
MKVEVEVVSKEIITPSSPTPAHLRHYQLSSLDQLSPLVYNPLVLFYEFNDKTGIPYLEAHVNCKLSDFLKNPIPDQLSKFLPFELDDHIGKELALGVQLSIYECGGKIWAAKARGESNIEHPDFLSGTRFLLKDVMAYDSSFNSTRNKVTKRFLFNASMIEALKAEYVESAVGLEENQKPPSRVDALTSFIWS